MTIEWDSYREVYVVTDDEVEIASFSSLLAAEAFVIGESKRREALP